MHKKYIQHTYACITYMSHCASVYTWVCVYSRLLLCTYICVFFVCSPALFLFNVLASCCCWVFFCCWVHDTVFVCGLRDVRARMPARRVQCMSVCLRVYMCWLFVYAGLTSFPPPYFFECMSQYYLCVRATCVCCLYGHARLCTCTHVYVNRREIIMCVVRLLAPILCFSCFYFFIDFFYFMCMCVSEHKMIKIYIFFKNTLIYPTCK